MSAMECKKCNSKNCIKKGLRGTKQRFYCKDCESYFQSEYIYQASKSEVNEFVVSLLKEGCGVRSIARILSISSKTVLSRILKISNQIRIPYFNKFGCKFEVDEMFIKISNGKSQNWLIYAIEQKTKNVVGFIVGSRSSENLKHVIDKVLLLNPKRIYTDRLNIYPSIIPKEIHKRFQYCTNRIERMNLNLRTHIKRLSRKNDLLFKKQSVP